MPHAVLTVFSALLGFSFQARSERLRPWADQLLVFHVLHFAVMVLVYWLNHLMKCENGTCLPLYTTTNVYGQTCIYIYIYKHFDRVVYLVQIQQSCVLVSFPSNDPTCSKLRVPMWCTLSVCILHENEFFFSLLLHLHFFFFPFLFHV